MRSSLEKDLVFANRHILQHVLSHLAVLGVGHLLPHLVHHLHLVLEGLLGRHELEVFRTQFHTPLGSVVDDRHFSDELSEPPVVVIKIPVLWILGHPAEGLHVQDAQTLEQEPAVRRSTAGTRGPGG